MSCAAKFERLLPLFATCVLSASAWGQVDARSDKEGAAVFLRGATVFDGSKVLGTANVLIVDGKIAAVGSDVDAPVKARVLDCAGRWITPGLVDANTALGLPSPQENEQSNEVTPHLEIVDLYDVEAQSVVHARRNGVTTAYITPGELNVFGGLGAVVKTAGDEPVVMRENGMRMTLGNMPGQGNAPFRTFGKPVGMYFRRPSNRMGVIWEVRKAFYDALDERETAPDKVAMMSASTRTLIRALDKELVVRTSARADQDIRTAIRLAEEFGIRLVLDHVTEAYACLDDVVAAGFPVLLTAPTLSDDPEGATPHLDTAALLAARGVTLAIQSGTDPRADALVREAAFAVRGGLSREVALAAITSVPAKILGIDDRVGSLAAGKDGDLVIWSGHPLSLASKALTVFIEGVER